MNPTAADIENQQLSLKPAVSGLNGKVAGGYLFYDGPTASSQHNAFVEGSLAGPISERFGYQIDAAIAGGDLNTFGGIGGHVEGYLVQPRVDPGFLHRSEVGIPAVEVADQ